MEDLQEGNVSKAMLGPIASPVDTRVSRKCGEVQADLGGVVGAAMDRRD